MCIGANSSPMKGRPGTKPFFFRMAGHAAYKTLPNGGTADHLLSDRRRYCRFAQRPVANRRSFFLGFDGCRGRFSPRRAHHECSTISPVWVPRSCGPLLATKPRSLNTWSTSVGATPSSAQPISSWSWPRGSTLVGLATHTEFTCPLSQFVLADALGLTSIHINCILRQLREDNCSPYAVAPSPSITWRAPEAVWFPRRLFELTRLNRRSARFAPINRREQNAGALTHVRAMPDEAA